MFGGIIETTGKLTQITKEDHCKHFSISPETKLDDLKIGDSISVNGVCLTITSIHDAFFNVTLVPETLSRSNLDSLMVGSSVNLERALRVGERIGGHYIQGHVDGVGEIISLKEVSNHELQPPLLIEMSIPLSLKKYLIPKGFISLDGMSITIIDVTPSSFIVTLIPHTQVVTIAKNYGLGTKINIEVDMVGKYIDKLVEEHIHANSN